MKRLRKRANRKRRNTYRPPTFPNTLDRSHAAAGKGLVQASGRKRRNRRVPDLPPNDHVNKHPDEVYGDTEIPDRNEEV